MPHLAQQYGHTLKRHLSSERPQYRGISLPPAGLVFAEKPTIISTLLGSCVAVTLYCRSRKMGAMCHALLPVCRPEICACSKHKHEYRSIECSIEEMLGLFAARGIFPKDLEAKIFGGATILDFGHDTHYGVGRKNVDRAAEILDNAGLHAKSSHVGGESGRRLYFVSDVGDVFLRRIEPQSFTSQKR